MTEPWRHSIARISGRHGTGTAFVIDEHRIITCFHNLQGGRIGDLDVYFPLSEVHVTSWQVQEQDPRRDIAVLQTTKPLPVQAHPLRWSTHRVRGRFTTYGFSDPGVKGLRAEGVIYDTSPGHAGVPLLQLDECNTIAQGFSGAPVIDVDRGTVVGMVTTVTTTDEDGRGAFSSFAVPTSEAAAVAPRLLREAKNPYRGLQPFERADSELFHGRDRALRQLVNAFGHQNSVITLLGPSGSGKSSLVRAGLVPRLGEGVIPDNRTWYPAVLTARGLLDWQSRQGQAAAHQNPRAISDFVEHYLSKYPEIGRLLLVVDQFEDLLHPANDATRARVLSQVVGLADLHIEVTLLIVCRDDFYPRIASAAPTLVDGIHGIPVNLPARLTQEEILSIVTAPADAVGLGVESGVAERVAAGLTESGRDDAPVSSLPLLEVFLSELFRRSDRYTLRLDDLRSLGGVSRALTDWCDRTFDNVDPHDRDTARWCCLALVDTGDVDGVPPHRRRLGLDALVKAVQMIGTRPLSAHDVDRVVRILIAQRLLIAARAEGDRDPSGSPVGADTTVQLVHDSLIWHWQRLADWLKQDRDTLRWLDDITRRAQRWQSKGSTSLLLDEVDMEEARRRTQGRRPSDEVELYLQASRTHIESRQRAQRRQQRARNVLLAVTSTMVVLLVVAVSWIAVQRRAAVTRALEADSQRLAAQADAAMNDQPDLGQLLAAESLAVADTEQAWTTTINALRVPIHVGRAVQGASRGPTHVAASSDGRVVAVSDSSGAVRVWAGEVFDGPGTTLPGSLTAASPLAVSADGALVVGVDDHRRLVAWDATSGTRVHEVPMGSDEHPAELAFRGQTQEVGVLNRSRNVLRIDLAASEPKARTLVRLDRTPATDQGFAFSRDGSLLAVSEGRQVRLWNVVHDQPLRQWPTIADGIVTGVAFSPDGTILAAGSDDRMVRLWRVGGSNEAVATGTGHNERITDVAFSADGRRLVTASTDHSVRIREVTAAAQLGESTVVGVDPAPVHDVFFVGADAEVIAGTDDTEARSWQTTEETSVLDRPSTTVKTLAFSPDGRLLVSGDDTGVVTVLDVARREIVKRIATGGTTDRVITQIRFSGDGRSVVAAGSDGTVSMWDVTTGHRSLLITVGTSYVAGMDLSPDSTMIVTGNGQGLVQLWDARTGNPIGQAITAHEGRVDNVVFDGSGTMLASTGHDDATIKLWDVATQQQVGRPMQAVPGSAVWGVAFSPDGALLATTGADFSLRLWGVADQTPIGEPLTGHRGATDGVAFSPDGHFVATSSADHTIRLWHLDGSGQLGGPLVGHGSWVDPLVFSHDGRWLASASVGADERSIRLWNLDRSSWSSELCRRAGRALTPSEWALYKGAESDYEPICSGTG